MPMTHDELGDLDRLLCRMERHARSWRWTRWLGIAMGLLMLGAGIWLFTLLSDVRPPPPEDPGKPVDAFDLMRARNSIMGIGLLWIMGTFQMSLGSILMIGSLCRWRKGRNELLLLKMARSWMEAQHSSRPREPGTSEQVAE